MNRSKTYLEYSQTIADLLLFLQNAKTEREQLEKKLNEYLLLVKSNKTVFHKFPYLVKEIHAALTINEFNAETSGTKIEELKKLLVKLAYIHDMLNDIEQIKNPVLEEKISLAVTKTKFINAANNLLFRSVDTLHFEMQHFEQVFKKAVQQLNEEKQKREKVRSLMGQDLPLLSQFPVIEAELRKIVDGEMRGSIGPDYIISNYPSIRDNLGKLNEFSRYFSKLSNDYMQILNGCDLQIFQTAKNTLSLSNLSGEFLKINAKASEYKNKVIKLDTLRNLFTNLHKDVNEKIGELSANHQSFVKDEMAKTRELLLDKVGREYEKAEAKINTIKEVLKKEFKSNDQKATDALYIRQSIARYDNNIWQEDSTSLYETLNDFASGKPGWGKDDFVNAIQRFIKQRNEALELTKTEFELFFEKNREYKNRFEKIANTKSSKRDLEVLVNEMSSFKPLKNLFYKFIK